MRIYLLFGPPSLLQRIAGWPSVRGECGGTLVPQHGLGFAVIAIACHARWGWSWEDRDDVGLADVIDRDGGLTDASNLGGVLGWERFLDHLQGWTENRGRRGRRRGGRDDEYPRVRRNDLHS